MEHHICTSYGVSSDFYGGIHKKLAGTGQGNVVSVNIYYGTTSIIFKSKENQ